MPTYRFRFLTDFPEGGVEADSPEEALAKAQEIQDYYSGSNDGSEWLANAELHIVED